MEEVLNNLEVNHNLRQKDWVGLFLKNLQEEKPSLWIEEERKLGQLGLYFPELVACFSVQQNRFHRYDVYYHLIYSCDAAPKNSLTLRLSALFHDIGKALTQKKVGEEYAFYNHEIKSTEIAYEVLNRWEVPLSLIKKVTLLVRYHMFHYQDFWTDSAVRRLIRKVGIQNIEDLFLLRVADREGNGFRQGEPLKLKDFRQRIQDILKEEKKFKITDLKINGQDLIALGIKPSPKMGEILKILHQEVEKKALENFKETLKEEVKKRFL